MAPDSKKSARVLLFGGSGVIGGAIADRFVADQWSVTAVARNSRPDGVLLGYDPFADSDGTGWADIAAKGPFDAVVWSQGANANDSIRTVDIAAHMAMYQANCLYITVTLQKLLQDNLLTKPARLCIISSIWQDMARQNKFSYCVSKAALHGLVLSAAVDLGADGHLVNAVLPGVLDTPMTRANLKPEQIAVVENATLFKRLPQLADVANTVHFLCSPANTGITGQFITADLGFSNVRIL